MRTIVRRWSVSSLTMCAPMTPPSVCLRRNFAMAKMTAQMAPTRSCVVRRDREHQRQQKICFLSGLITGLCSFFSTPPLILSPSLSLTDLCSLDNGDCSHNCTVAPGEGVICSCPLGMELGPDNKTCQIQSFCAKHLKCSQRCEQDKFSVKCSCYEGWELEPDMENCKSTGEGAEEG